MESIKKNQKILIGLVLFLVIIVIPLVLYAFLRPKFRISEFQDHIEINYQSNFEAQSGKVCYGNMFSCKDVSVTENGQVDTSKIGQYLVKYTYQFQDDVFEKEQKVTVVDKEAPTITVINVPNSYCPNGKVVDYKVTAFDNYDGDLSSKVVVEGKDEKITFTVEDTFGNIASVQHDASLSDKSAPQITLNGKENIYLLLNGSYKELGAHALDDCDGDLTSDIVISGEVNTSKVGEYILVYTAKDKSGNEAKKERHVFVYENKNYETSSGKTIYLTFDDGPGPYTEQLLNVLKKYNVKATFFVTNQALTKNYDSAILRAYKEGHTIGLHTNTHNYNIYTNEDAYFQDLYEIQNKVKRITGYTSNIMRFPGGSSNTISKNYDGGKHIMTHLSKAVEARGFRYFDWNISSGDAGSTTHTAQVVSNVINGLGNKNTYMVLQHDIKKYSVDAVESIIQFGLSHGYQFRPITMDTPTVHHHINN